MSLDLGAAIILSLFFALGAWRGFVAAGLGLLTLLLGYAGGVLAASLWAAPMGAALGLPALLAMPLAGTAGFLATWLLLSLLALPLRRADRERALGQGRGLVDRLLGGLVGSLRGALIVVLLSLAAAWLDAARDVSGGSGLAGMPDTEGSLAVAASSRAVESAWSASVGEEGAAGVAGRFLTRPEASMDLLRSVADDPDLRALQSDRVFWMYVEQGQAHDAVQRPAFARLVESEGLRRQLAALGAIDAATADDPQAFRARMEEALQELGPRIRALEQDPELQALVQDPEIRALLEAGDSWALLTDVRVHRVAARLAQGS